jgi:preprotein translocase subunit SecG
LCVHVIVCLFLIGVVLLQQGKSADLAGAFGGQGSQTAFGPRGAANLLTKLTTWGAVLFMLISISLTILLARDHSVLSGTPASRALRRSKASGAAPPSRPGRSPMDRNYIQRRRPFGFSAELSSPATPRRAGWSTR